MTTITNPRPYNARDWEVRAFLSGSKTRFSVPCRVAADNIIPCPYVASAWSTACADDREGAGCHCKDAKCPYHIGDTIPVREAWAYYSGNVDGLEAEIVYRASYNEAASGSAESQGATKRFSVNDDIASEAKSTVAMYEVCGERWNSSAVMPLEFVRLHLHVTNASVARLQEVTHKQLEAEGRFEQDSLLCRTEFSRDWDARYPKHQWASNPHVFSFDVEVRE